MCRGPLVRSGNLSHVSLGRRPIFFFVELNGSYGGQALTYKCSDEIALFNSLFCSQFHKETQ
jgi:hypothetical protein